MKGSLKIYWHAQWNNIQWMLKNDKTKNLWFMLKIFKVTGMNGTRHEWPQESTNGGIGISSKKPKWLHNAPLLYHLAKFSLTIIENCFWWTRLPLQKEWRMFLCATEDQQNTYTTDLYQVQKVLWRNSVILWFEVRTVMWSQFKTQ